MHLLPPPFSPVTFIFTVSRSHKSNTLNVLIHLQSKPTHPSNPVAIHDHHDILLLHHLALTEPVRRSCAIHRTSAPRGDQPSMAWQNQRQWALSAAKGSV